MERKLNTGDDSCSFEAYRGANRVIFAPFQGQTKYYDIQDDADTITITNNFTHLSRISTAYNA
jgi:hypothetical protein